MRAFVHNPTNCRILALLSGVLISLPVSVWPNPALSDPISGNRELSTATGDFADFLLTRDLVFVGTVLRSSDTTTVEGPACDPDAQTRLRGTIFSVRADSVIVGSAPFPWIRVFSFGRSESHFVNPSPAGTRVLAFGSLLCGDSTQFLGDVMSISEDGRLLTEPANDIRLLADGGTGTTTLQGTLASILQHRFAHSDRAFVGTNCVALVRITSRSAPSVEGYSVTPKLVAWLTPSSTTLPSALMFDRIAMCPAIEVGDTVALPLGRRTDSAPMRIHWCPKSLIVRGGIAPLLGTRPRFISSVLVRVDSLQVCRQSANQTYS